MNELLILFVLNIKSANIYEIQKYINVHFSPFVQLSTGAIIPALKRLEAANCVISEKKITDGGLRKTIYSILPDWEQYVKNLLLENKNVAPQILRHNIDIIFSILEHNSLTDKQNEFIVKYLQELLEKNITVLEKAISQNELNIEFLHIELVATDAKLRLLKELYPINCA